MLADACVCCGLSWPTKPNVRTESGPVHFDCWSEHHSDPTGPWPPNHLCAVDLEGGAS